MNAEESRYASQLSIPQIGAAGQRRLAKASVLVVGAGGLGSALLFCLVGAGVGHIGIMDGDRVSRSNLNRQFLYVTNDIGAEKAVTAGARLRLLNPDIQIDSIPAHLTPENADESISPFDLVVLAVDQKDTRLTANHICCRRHTPLVSGGVDGMNGSVSLVIPGTTPCLECLCGHADGQVPADTTAKPDSFGPVVSVISALEAQLALLTLLDQAPLPFDRFLFFEGLQCRLISVKLLRNPDCRACGPSVCPPGLSQTSSPSIP